MRKYPVNPHKKKDPADYKHKTRAVVGINVQTQEITHYPSITKAADACYADNSGISQSLKKGTITSGCKWMYLEQYQAEYEV